MGNELWRAHPICYTRLCSLRRVRGTCRLACRQVEPQGHDGRLLRRHRPELNLHRARGNAAPDRNWPFSYRPLRGHLPSGRSCAGRAGAQEHGCAARHQRDFRQHGGGLRGAHHGVSHRPRGLAVRLRLAWVRINRNGDGLRRAPVCGAGYGFR